MISGLAPNALIVAVAMPAFALIFGALAPEFGAPARDRTPRPLRGVHVSRLAVDCKSAVAMALRKRRTVLAGVVLDPAAETRHTKILGITGSGKSTAILPLMHTALERGDRCVVIDFDGAAMRKFWRPGDTILNPYDVRSARWSFLLEIAAPSDYSFLAEALLPAPADAGEHAWVIHAQEVFAAAMETWHTHGLGDADLFFKTVRTGSVDALAALCAGTAAAIYFDENNRKMLDSVLATLRPPLRGIEQLSAISSGAPFSVRQWVAAGTGTLWIPYRHDQAASLRGLIACWAGLAIAATLALDNSHDRRTWFHLDELDAIGKIPALPDALTRIRKKGGAVVLGVQTYAQIEQLYGKNGAATIIENCGNTLILRCGVSSGGGTARLASEIIGDREIIRTDRGRSRSRGRAPSTNHSEADRHSTEPAVLPSEIEGLGDNTGFLRIATNPDWVRLGYQRLDFPDQAVPSFVPHPQKDLDKSNEIF